MGGTDDPSNLVKLTIKEHAEAHRVLYETHGHWEDKIAWLGLSKLINKEEILTEILKNRKSIKGIPKPAGFGKKISKAIKGREPWNKGKVLGPYSQERKDINSRAQKKSRKKCPVCDLETNLSNYNRYGHGNECKKNGKAA